MRAALNEISSNNVRAVSMGSTACNYVYEQNTKIWPDNSGRVAKIVLQGYTQSGLNARYWYNEARARIQVVEKGIAKNGCNANNYSKVTVSGNVYHVGKTYNGTALATYSRDDTNSLLTLTFEKGTGPVASAVAVGDKVSIQTVCAGWSEAYTTNSTKDFLDVKYQLPMIESLTLTYQCQISVAGRGLRMYVYPIVQGVVKGEEMQYIIWPPNTGTRYTYTLKPRGNSNNSAVQEIPTYGGNQYLSEGTMVSIQGLDWAAYSSIRANIVAFNTTTSLEIKTITRE